MNRILVLMLSVCAAGAQVGLAPPRRGVVAGDSGWLRPLVGVPGSLIAGAPLRGRVVSAASSGRYTLIKTPTKVEVLFDDETLHAAEAPEGTAIFAFRPDGAPGLVHFPSTGGVMLWDGRAFRPGWTLAGTKVLAAAVRSSGIVAVAAAGEEHVRIETRSLRDGGLAAMEAFPPARGPVLLDPGGTVVYWDGTELVADLPGSPPLRSPLPYPPGSLEQAGDGLMVARCGEALFGLVLTPGRMLVFQLPEAPAGALP